MIEFDKNDIEQIKHIRARASWYVGRLGDGTYAMMGFIPCCKRC